MKRKTIILSAVTAVALASIATMAVAEDDDDRSRGWCNKGKGEYGMRGHHGGGGMMGMMGGHHMKRFMKNGTFDMQLTPERVKEIMEGKIAMFGNDNLKVGEISTDKDGQIIAQLVTKDNSLVETFKVDPKTGAHSPLR